MSTAQPAGARAPEPGEPPFFAPSPPPPEERPALRSLPSEGVGAVPLVRAEALPEPAEPDAGRVSTEYQLLLPGPPAPPAPAAEGLAPPPARGRDRSSSLRPVDRQQRYHGPADLYRGRSRASSMARAPPLLSDLPDLADLAPPEEGILEPSSPSEARPGAADSPGGLRRPPSEPVSPETQRAREELAFALPRMDGLDPFPAPPGAGGSPRASAERPRLAAAPLSPEPLTQDGDLFLDPLASLGTGGATDEGDQSETRSETRSETAGLSRGEDQASMPALPAGAAELGLRASRQARERPLDRRSKSGSGSRAVEGAAPSGEQGPGAVSLVEPPVGGADPAFRPSEHQSVSVSKTARQRGPGPDIAACLETLKCSDFEARQDALRTCFTNREIFVPELSDSDEPDQPRRLTLDPARLQYGELYPQYLENSWFFRFNRRGEFKTPMNYSDQDLRVRSCTYKYPSMCGTSELVFQYYVAGDPTNDPVLVLHDFYQSPQMLLPFLNQLAAENKCAYCMDTTAVAARTGAQELVVCLCEFLLNVCLHFRAAVRRPSSLVMGAMQETTRRISLIGQGSGANLALKIAIALTILTDGVDSLYDYSFSKSATSRLMRSGLTAVNITTLVTIKSVVLCNPLMPSFVPALRREGRLPYKLLKSLKVPAFISPRRVAKSMPGLFDYFCPFCPDELLAHYISVVRAHYGKDNYVSMYSMSTSGQTVFREDAEYETEVRSTRIDALAGGPVVTAGATAATTEKEPVPPRRLSTNANLEGMGAREGSIPANVLLAQVADATSTAASLPPVVQEQQGASGQLDAKAFGLSVEDLRPTGDYNDITELYNSLTARHKSNLALAIFIGSENRYITTRDMRRLKYIDARDSNIFLRTIPAAGQDMLNTCKNLLTKFV